MPIKGLTDRGASFPRIGELRKGGEKPQTGNKPGPDLKHFRFTSQHPEVLEKFLARYGTHSTAVNVYLPFATAFENFEAWIEEWGAGSLKWRGDGETLVIWQKPDGTYSTDPKPQPAGGKQTGRLKVIIPELGRLAYVVALTTSLYDIAEMAATLDAYEALRGDLRGIPFVLSRVPRMVSTPGQDGQRVRREKWLWHLEAQPAWVQAQLSVMQRAALPTGPIVEGQYQIGAGAIDLDTGEIFDDEPEEVYQQARPRPRPAPAPAPQPELVEDAEFDDFPDWPAVGQTVLMRGNRGNAPVTYIGSRNGKAVVNWNGKELEAAYDRLSLPADEPAAEDKPVIPPQIGAAEKAEQALVAIISAVNMNRTDTASEKMVKAVAINLKKCVGDDKRDIVLQQVFQVSSATELTAGQAGALLEYIGSNKDNNYTPDPDAIAGLNAIVMTAE